MTINEKQDELIEDFELFDDQLDKTQYIIDLGKKLQPIAEEYKSDENLIRGCQSRVWLHTEMRGDRVHFEADSDVVKLCVDVEGEGSFVFFEFMLP